MKQIVDQLASHGLLYHLIEGLPIRIFWKDGEGQLLGCNTHFARDAGFERPDELRGKRDFDLTWRAEAQRYLAEEQRIMATGEAVIGHEESQRLADGSTRWLRLSRLPLRDEQQKVRGILGVYEDITEQRALDEALHLTQFVSDQAPDSILWVDCDARIRYANEAACRALGYSRAELQALSIPDIDPSSTPQTWPAHWQQLQQQRHLFFESAHRRKDGERVDVEVSANFVSYRGLEYNVAFIRDISERKRVEESLRRDAAFRSQLFEQAAEGISRWRLSHNDAFVEFLDWNRRMQEITGYSREEINRKGWLQAIYTDEAERERARQVMLSVLDGRINRGADFEIVTKDGEHRVLTISSALVQGDGGEPCVLAVMQDISERRQLEERLRQSQKMEAIGTLVGGIAHDFNNMLAAIQGNIYLARQELAAHPVADDRLASIELLGDRAAEMVQQLLTFARKDAVVMHIFSLNAFMQESYRLNRTAIPESIDQRLELCSEPLFVRGDATQLQQMLMNLINNAVDAVEGAAQPQVRCSLMPFEADEAFRQRHPDLEESLFACITVQDNGSGIDPAHLEKIFEPFFTTKEVGKGTGLGLAMLYGAVHTHGGTVEVESVPAHGTTFRLYLPLCDEDGETPAAGRAANGGGGHGETILLVDDEESLRQVSRSVLSKMGYEVLEAADGVEALEQLQSQPQIALLISDVIMPHMGGVELLRELRRSDAGLPVILVTGYGRDHVLGIDDADPRCTVINKPYHFNDLAATIARMLNKES